MLGLRCRQLQTRDLRSHGLHRVRTNWHVQACQRTNVRDEDMSRTNDTKPPTPPIHNNNDDDDSAGSSPPSNDDISVDSDALNIEITRCSYAIWDELEVRMMQEKIVDLLLDPNCPNNILAVYATGSGKSHVIRLVGVMDRGYCCGKTAQLLFTRRMMFGLVLACMILKEPDREQLHCVNKYPLCIHKFIITCISCCCTYEPYVIHVSTMQS
jgi:hypothetical protein